MRDEFDFREPLDEEEEEDAAVPAVFSDDEPGTDFDDETDEDEETDEVGTEEEGDEVDM